MTGKSRRPVRKFSPGTHQTDEEVKQQFVVRNHELDVLLDVLRGNIRSQSCQHALVTAPRGRGKTMLLARTAAEIRTNPEFAEHFLPVSYMEESHEIFNMTDFWLETLFHLARECACHDPLLAEELQERHAALSARWREQSLEVSVQAAVLEASDRLDRRLVLMVENIQSLCNDTDEEFGWKLRDVLQTEPQIILLGTATCRFAGLENADQPFFEMFRTIDLKPLTTGQCRKLWNVVSDDNVAGREIRPLEILTGGSPRLLVIVAGFGQHKSLRLLMEELVALIDDHTEYFRGHLDILSKTERRIYAAVLDLWQHSTPGEIAARARMDARVVSTMLGRLVERGALVFEGGGRKRRYAAAEPLYCIYYKLRRSRGEAAVVTNLIRFMSVFYSEAEKAELFPSLVSEGIESLTLRNSLEKAGTVLPDFAEYIARFRQPAISAVRPNETEHSRKSFQEHEGSVDANGSDQDAMIRIFNEIYTAFKSREFKKVVKIVDRSRVIQNPTSHGLSQAIAASALTMKANALRELGNLDSALSTYEEIIERFEDSAGPMRQTESGPALERSLSFDDRVELLFQIVVALALVSKGQVTDQSGNPKSALPAYQEVVDRFGRSGVPELRVFVAKALGATGCIRLELGERAMALSAFKEVVERFCADDDVEVGRIVAMTQFIRGNALRESGEPELAVSTYDEIVERFEGKPDLEPQSWVALSLICKGRSQTELGDWTSAVSTYEAVIQKFGRSESEELAAHASEAMIRKGDALVELKDLESGVAAFDALLEQIGRAEDASQQGRIAYALFKKGNALRELNQLDSALSAYREAVERFGSSENADTLRCVGAALAWTRFVLRQSGDLDAAISSSDDTVRRFGSSEDPGLRGWVVPALIDKAEMLIEIGHSRDALRTCSEFESLLRNLNGAFERDLKRRAFQVWVRALLIRPDLPIAMRLFRSFYEAFEPDDDGMLRAAQHLIPELIAAGGSVHELLEVLLSDDGKAAALSPVIAALRQHSGETVRGPEEILRVAADVGRRIQEARVRRPDSIARAVLDT